VEASDSILAFWDGKSRGTYSTIKIAQSQLKTLEIVKY
jgi:hypothetical protein